VSVVVVELLVLFVWVSLFLVFVGGGVVVVWLSTLLHIGCQDVTRELGEAKRQSTLAGQMLATIARAM
jgi:hypothetical protein